MEIARCGYNSLTIPIFFLKIKIGFPSCKGQCMGACLTVDHGTSYHCDGWDHSSSKDIDFEMFIDHETSSLAGFVLLNLQ